MNKLLILSSLILTTSIATAKVTYLPSDYDTFKKTGSCPSCDLSNLNIDVGYGGPQAPYNLKNANLSGSMIRMSNNTLSDYSDVNGINADFSYGGFSQSSFQNAILINSNFAHTNLTNTNFEGADVRGADFSNANLYGAHGINFPVVKSVCNAIMPDGSTGQCS